MNEPADIEQICEAGLATLFADCGKFDNQQRISACVEEAYKSLIRRAKESNKVVVNVAQTISTEVVESNSQQVLYIITLVGTVVDAELIKQQQRAQQFGAGVVKNPRMN